MTETIKLKKYSLIKVSVLFVSFSETVGALRYELILINFYRCRLQQNLKADLMENICHAFSNFLGILFDNEKFQLNLNIFSVKMKIYSEGTEKEKKERKKERKSLSKRSNGFNVLLR